MSKQKGNRLHTDLIGIPEDEIIRRSKDRSLSRAERRRYQEQAKALGLRNRQKRQK